MEVSLNPSYTDLKVEDASISITAQSPELYFFECIFCALDEKDLWKKRVILANSPAQDCWLLNYDAEFLTQSILLIHGKSALHFVPLTEMHIHLFY